MKKGGPIFAQLNWSYFDDRPIIVALAGSNGAGKSTFYETFLKPSGLPFVNADMISLQSGCDAYTAAKMAEQLRQDWVREKRSFIFETVLSDPVGEKVDTLEQASHSGYNVALIFIGIGSPEISRNRVALRVAQGGHDVPDDKIAQRYFRTLENLRRAIQKLPFVLVYDHSDFAEPYREVGVFENGVATMLVKPAPKWFSDVEV